MKKGFCFVEFTNYKDAAYACSKMNGREFCNENNETTLLATRYLYLTMISNRPRVFKNVEIDI